MFDWLTDEVWEKAVIVAALGALIYIIQEYIRHIRRGDSQGGTDVSSLSDWDIGGDGDGD